MYGVIKANWKFAKWRTGETKNTPLPGDSPVLSADFAACEKLYGAFEIGCVRRIAGYS